MGLCRNVTEDEHSHSGGEITAASICRVYPIYKTVEVHILPLKDIFQRRPKGLLQPDTGTPSRDHHIARLGFDHLVHRIWYTR